MNIQHLKDQLLLAQNRLQKATDGADLPAAATEHAQRVIEKFFAFCTLGTKISFSKLEIKILVQHLATKPESVAIEHDNIIESPFRNKALSLISDHWDERFIKPLFQLYLRLWNPKKINDSAEVIQKHLIDNLEQNQPKLSFGKTILTHREVFLANSALIPERVSLHLLQELHKKTSVEKILQTLPLYETYWKTQLSEYTTLLFTEKLSETTGDSFVLQVLSQILKKHKSMDINYLTISYLICDFHKYAHLITKDSLISFVIKNLDIKIDKTWILKYPHKYPPQSQENLHTAYAILMRWLYGKLIRNFFDKIAFDKTRATFWENQPCIEDITILVPDRTKEKFFYDGIIPLSFIQKKVKVNYLSSNNSAILMQTKTHLLVDFSEAGNAFYAYLLSSKYSPHKLVRPTLEDLKSPELRYKNAITVASSQYDPYSEYDPVSGNLYITSPEGRAFHQGEWQPKFKYWLNKYIA